MNAVREFPPNPHALVVHTEAPLTEEVVESYLPGNDAPTAWMRSLLQLPGIRVLSLNAYKVRVQKHKAARWHAVLPAVEAVLSEGLGIGDLDDLVEHESRTRLFCWHGEPLERAVYEGRRQSRAHSVAAPLFALAGVAEVVVDGHRVQVRKCPLHSWSVLAPRIEQVLGGGDPGAEPPVRG